MENRMHFSKSQHATTRLAASKMPVFAGLAVSSVTGTVQTSLPQ